MEINGKWLNIQGVNKYLLSNIQRIFGHLWGIQQQNWCHIFKSVSKTGKIKRTKNYIFFFQNKCDSSLKEKWVFRGSSHFFWGIIVFLKYNLESTIFNQLLKLIWECDNFFFWDLQKWSMMRLLSDFHLCSRFRRS